MSARVAVLIPAAGGGRRFGGVSKPFLTLAGEPVLARTLRPFLQDTRVTRVIVALPPEVRAAPPAWLAGIDPRIVLIDGGRERSDSVRAALARVPADVDVVVVHDAARPLVSAALVDRAIQAAAAGRSVVAALPAADTVQRVDAERRIVDTPERAALWLAQTPQAFPRAVLMNAYGRGGTATDDAALVLRAGGTVHVIEGDVANLKLTVPVDLVVAEALLQARGDA